jgi:AcrR family transcriptional regulator
MAATTRGRPRSFDRDAALDSALRLFWTDGYEATSIGDLTAAMGIGAPSLYAAFGDKATLFREVVERYGVRHGGFIARALTEEPTARLALERILREAAVEYTRPGWPRGCMIVSAGVNTTSLDIAELLRDLRRDNVAVIAARIRTDVAAGLLPIDTDADALARYIGAVIQGLSQSARDGATRPQLARVAALALHALP